MCLYICLLEGDQILQVCVCISVCWRVARFCRCVFVYLFVGGWPDSAGVCLYICLLEGGQILQVCVSVCLSFFAVRLFVCLPYL